MPCDEEFDPYEVLGVQKGVSKEELRKIHKKLQFETHPSMPTGDHEKFIMINLAYEKILKSRGIIDLLLDFKKNYVDSEEEKQDLKILYQKHQGDMKKIIDNHLCCEDEDEERLRVILDSLIKNNEIKKFENYEKKVSNDIKRKIRRQKEKNIIGQDTLMALQASLSENEQKRKQRWNEFEQKYSLQLPNASDDVNQENPGIKNTVSKGSKPILNPRRKNFKPKKKKKDGLKKI